MFLIINTTQRDNIEIIFARSAADFKIKKIIGERRQSEKLLPAIDKFLKISRVKLSQINGLGVVSGPGGLVQHQKFGAGFTSLRIGAATANALAYALKSPVIGIGADEFKNNEELVAKTIQKIKETKIGGVVLPTYGGEPNITIKKE